MKSSILWWAFHVISITVGVLGLLTALAIGLESRPLGPLTRTPELGSMLYTFLVINSGWSIVWRLNFRKQS